MMMPPNILIVDDDLRMRQLVFDTLASDGIKADICAGGNEAVQRLQEEHIDILITDLMMPHLDGLELLGIARKINPECVVIVITGYGTIESAIEAIRKGAYDYIQKPFEPDALVLTVTRARTHIQLLHENKLLRRQVSLHNGNELIGVSRPMIRLKESISKIAPFDTTVLVQGETGTGKELVAKLIHQWSPRRTEMFLPINCGALPQELLEAELFGHKRGSFTGAIHDKKGLFEAAGKGTIFLDEINSISASFQVKLLRVLQEGAFLPIGGREPQKIEARVVAAGNVPLSQEVEAGRFRSDLYYRLNVFPVLIPSLRERKEDVMVLAQHFLTKYARKYDLPVRSIKPELTHLLKNYPWPGNVRELENLIERGVIISEGEVLDSIDLPGSAALAAAGKLPIAMAHASLEDMEKKLIACVLADVGGSRRRAVEILKISPATLWRKMKKYQLQ